MDKQTVSQKYPSDPDPQIIEQMKSVDERIANENIRARSFLNPQSSRTQVSGFVSWITLNKRLVLAVVVFLVVSSTVTSLILANKHQQPAGDATLTQSDTTNSDLTGEIDPEAGSDLNSGTGVLAEGGDPSLAPETPSKITIVASATELSVSWAQIKTATQYIVQISTTASFSDPRTVISGDTSVTIFGLTQQTDYYLRVSSVGPSSTSSWSTVQKSRTTRLSPTQIKQPLPSRVSTLKGAATSTHSIKLSWSSALNAERYSLIRASNSSMTSDRHEYAATSSTTYTAADLSPGTTYYLAIQPSNHRGAGPLSNIVRVKTDINIPVITAVKVTSSSLTPSWSKEAGALKYTVQVAKDSDFKTATTITTSNQSATFSSLDGGTIHYLRVRAADDTTNTNWSRTATATTAVRVPSGLKLSSPTTSSIKLSWTSSHGATKYNTRYSVSSSMSSSSSKLLTGTSTTLTGLKAGTKYYFQVRAYDGHTWTAWSTVAVGNTKIQQYATFKMATFNILGSGHTDYSGSGWPDSSIRLPKEMKALEDNGISVAALQEVFPDQQKMILKQYSNKWGMAIKDAPGQGRAVIWRKDKWQKINVKYIAVPAVGTKYQALVLLEQKQTGKRIWFMGIHNVNGTGSAEREKRKESLKRELTAIKAVKSNGYPIFIAGDFNDGPDSNTSAQCMLTPYMTNIFGSTGPGVCGKPKTDTRVDHIFYIGASKVRIYSAKVIKTYTGRSIGITDHPLVISTVVPR